MTHEIDLFGNPVRPGRGQRGRPPFEVTEKDRNKVKLLLAIGWQAQRIANALDVSLATLKRYFRAELQVRDQMADRMEARRWELVVEQANAGNVGAMKEWRSMMEAERRAMAQRQLTRMQEGGPAEARPEKLGKKEAARKAANNLGGDDEWGDDLLPQLRTH